MKVTTNKLSGVALDWEVAKCEGVVNGDALDIGFIKEGGYTPSTDWAQGGLIIEREGISVWQFDDVTWKAEKPIVGVDCVYEAPTLLIAAMRCYVASKLGDEVEVPDELLEGGRAVKIKTSELSGAALDWAVADVTGDDVWRESRNIYVRDDCDYVSHYSPSTDWAQGGPIIEREKIGFRFSGGFGFCAWKSYGVGPHRNEQSQYGPTPLIAAMRCYVASKFGDEVKMSDELLEGESKWK